MKTILFIINPSSGRQNTSNIISGMIDELSCDFKIETFYTEKKDDAFNKAKAIENIDMVIGCGGDGTINEIIGGLIESGKHIPLGIYATGTVNDLATALHLPRDPKRFVSMIKQGKTTSIDIGKIGHNYFGNVVAGGVFTDVSFRVPKESKAKLGPLAYYIEGILAIPELFNISIPLSLEIDGLKSREQALIFLISNSKNIGGSTLLAPDATLDDGLFDVIIFRKCSFTDMVALSKDVLLNKHLKSPYVFFTKAKEIKIDSLIDIPEVDIDGEKGPKLPITIENINHAIDVIII